MIVIRFRMRMLMDTSSINYLKTFRLNLSFFDYSINLSERKHKCLITIEPVEIHTNSIFTCEFVGLQLGLMIYFA